MKKCVLFIGGAALLLCSLVIGAATAADVDKGPADMVLQAVKDKAKKAKPSAFPHAKHQEFLSCAECHHGGTPGNKTPYTEGMKIQKCEDCHYKGSDMPSKSDKEKGIVKLHTYKFAAHANCKTCHKKAAAEKPELKEKWSKKCSPCHGG